MNLTKCNSDQLWVVLQPSHFALIAIKKPSRDHYKGLSGDYLCSTIISILGLISHSTPRVREVSVSLRRPANSKRRPLPSGWVGTYCQEQLALQMSREEARSPRSDSLFKA